MLKKCEDAKAHTFSLKYVAIFEILMLETLMKR